MFRAPAAVALAASALALLPDTRADEPKTVQPFDGQTLKGWMPKRESKNNHWVVGVPGIDPKNPGGLVVRKDTQTAEEVKALVNEKAGGVDLATTQTFGDCRIELEFMIPKGSNSGIYLMGEYELQVFDSYGRDKLGMGDLGALYSAAAPKVNAARKPGEWQKFVIEFQAPRFKGDKKAANARFVKVTLNDQVIHEAVEMKGPTPGGLTGKEAPAGPLMFQGDHGPVAYRNIKITPRREE